MEPAHSVNPAATVLSESIGAGLAFGEVWIQPANPGHELRHLRDRGMPADSLRLRQVNDLRELARHSATGAFRPLSGAPTLPDGWHAHAPDLSTLVSALNRLYPGALADWHAYRLDPASATQFATFAGRQSGIYRSLSNLDPASLARVAHSCCDHRLCLKRRVWVSEGLPPEPAESKSVIPCLEPCPILMELARRALPSKDGDSIPVRLTGTDIQSVGAALEWAAVHLGGVNGGRVGDLGDPLNPRRILLALNRLRAALGGGEHTAAEPGGTAPAATS